jgi:hypothetical protein
VLIAFPINGMFIYLWFMLPYRPDVTGVPSYNCANDVLGDMKRK